MDDGSGEKYKSVTVGNLFSIMFLGITSLGYAFSKGFDQATTMDYIFAVITVVAGINIIYALDKN